MNRRVANRLLAGGTLGSLLSALKGGAAEVNSKDGGFRPRYILSSAMYGKMPLAAVLPEVTKSGAEAIDIWCLVHANHREQIDQMGHDEALALFEKYKVTPTVFTRYPLGPFKLQEEMRVAKKFGGKIIVCGSSKPSQPKGEEAKKAVKTFLEKMKPHIAAAEEAGITIAIENHSSQAFYHPDSLRYFAEFNQSKHIGIAFAPHHLHKFVPDIPKLIEDLGDRNIPFMYFQEHSAGMMKKLPKEIEMQQMPGFGGGLDYRPIVAALRKIRYSGWCEIFMHPVPRGIPILPTVKEITAAINQSRLYIDKCLDQK